MTGRFVIVTEDGDILQVFAWDDWLQIPVPDRSWVIFVVEATDALDAWLQATKQLKEEGADHE
jgi:hypothetical protein